MSFQAKDVQIYSRALATQTCTVNCDLVAGTSDLPSNVTIANGTITAVVITLDVNEAIAKAFSVRAVNRVTGAILPLAAAPSVSGETIAITVNGTAISDASIQFTYRVTE